LSVALNFCFGASALYPTSWGFSEVYEVLCESSFESKFPSAERQKGGMTRCAGIALPFLFIEHFVQWETLTTIATSLFAVLYSLPSQFRVMSDSIERWMLWCCFLVCATYQT